ncbi:hypothetical protein CHLRE_17g697950v5 [Chlamydomonas reinhardtii]|uniref:ADP,ATP carrier protein n=1 Tax=Chlamydomonas reinhardtii TaxID=3055 RepID=A0A2K3CNR3_CHLRE|nr:uncharacterized protein CHLRE_17g697950v5 [Chlamydomonas reinhardtii]PNW69913.1 hypothetical protein CHLRE_17g697950v5 [Chlamydomonas reinhardtii]
MACVGLPRPVQADAGPSTSSVAACSSMPSAAVYSTGLKSLRCRPGVLTPCVSGASCTSRFPVPASGFRAGQTIQAAASSSSSVGSSSRFSNAHGTRSSSGSGAASSGLRPGLQPQQRQQQPQSHRTDASSRRVAAAAAAAAAADGAGSRPAGGDGGLIEEAQKLVGTLTNQASRFWALSGKFMPMVGLFFMLAFVNTILDSLKDTLVITAAGGGAQVIPYLTVYAVLPSSLVFLLAYSYASQRFRRQTLFNGIVAVFMTFFAGFALWLYPNHHLLHPTSWAEGAAASLPLGLDGLVGMVRNWTFTLFFCMSELWGDVCLGLLFWGLANDTTSLADAPTLYPLFGLGANVAQALAGFVLKFFSGPASHGGSFTWEVQSLMAVVMVFSVAALALHHAISAQHNAHRAERRAARNAERAAQQQALSQAAAAAAARGDAPAAAAPALQLASASVDLPAAAQPQLPKDAASTRPKKSKQSMGEIYRTLASSVPIRCLVVMSMAQGLCTNLMEFAWKSHIRLLYPTPAEFTSFLGDVSTWQGIVTGLLMVLSPTMFERLGWAGVAAATPQILLYGGGAFFAVAMAYQFVMAPAAAAATASGAAAAAAASAAVLQLLVYGGALLYVFSKSAKFSLFKPAEEMVYISLDEEGRTKGKAAIDVVGSQAGKSGGSVLQQVLLLLCGGAIAGQLPIMVAVYLAMSNGWLGAVGALSRVANYGHQSTVHDSLTASMDEVPHTTAGGGSAGGSGASGSSSSSHSSSGNSHNGHGGHHNGNGNGHHHNHHVATAVTHGNGNGNGAQASHNGHNGNGNGHHNGHHTVIVAGESATVAGFVHSEHNGHTGQNAAAAEAVRAAAA